MTAPLFLHRKLHLTEAVASYRVISAGLILLIVVLRWFPACYVEGSGLTPFSEIVDRRKAARLVRETMQLREECAILQDRLTYYVRLFEQTQSSITDILSDESEA